MRIKIFTFFCVLGLAALLADSSLAQPRFTAALNAAQVVPPTNSTGRAHCTVGVTNNIVTTLTCEYWGLSNSLRFASVTAEDGGTCFAGVNGDGGTSGSFSKACTRIPVPPPALSSLLHKRARVRFHTNDPAAVEIQGRIKVVTLDSDVNGEGRSEISVFRPFEDASYSYCGMTGSIIRNSLDWHGNADDTPFMADFDGDGIADWASIRRDLANNTGELFVNYRRSGDNVLAQVQWGNERYGDIPAFGDYDGDGTIEKAVFRPANGIWYILETEYNTGAVRYENWGIAGDQPCPGDYDGDGMTDLCVVRKEAGQFAWYIRRSTDYQMFRAAWGLETDTFYPYHPVDVDADGINDILVSRDENGKRVFYSLRSSDGSMFALQWGLSSDLVKLGDYDADGKTDFAAVREIDGQLIWFINESSSGQMQVFNWGLPGDL